MEAKKVKTLWHGMVGLPSTLVDTLVNAGEGLAVWHDGDCMELSNFDLANNRKAMSEHQYHDRYGGDDYWLYYYEWKPTAVQTTLFAGVKHDNG